MAVLLLLRRPSLAWFSPAWRCWSSGDEALEVVRIPQAWRRRLEERQASGKEGPESFGGKQRKMLLRSRRRELSQALGRTVGRWEKPRLVSDGWKHRLSRGDHFQLERTRKEALQEEEGGEGLSFPALGLDPQFVTILEGAFGISRPTPVQKRAIPVLLKGSNTLCGAETGSGKTLAYLLPLVQRLLTSSHLPHKTGATTHPRSLVVLPSRELAGQVRSVAAQLCAPLGLEVRGIGGGRGMGSIRRKIHDVSVDLLIATPGALCKALRRHMVSLEQLLCLVLDEADTLLDPSFVDLVRDLLQQTPLASNRKEATDVWDPKTQVVAVGATLPKGLGELLSEVADSSSFRTITGYGLHYLQPHVEQKFMRLKGSDKVTEVLQLLKDRGPMSGAVLIFCNGASTVNWLSYILDDHKIKHLRLQGQMQADMRAGIFDNFQKGHSDILVCTDIASRGLDTTRVELVINYDFPYTLHDYLHRVGRVGRIGSTFPGTAVSFVTHRWDVDLVRKIETAARKRTCLPGLEPIVQKPLSKKK
ncbi:probable ATP-dependent RNA helicase DDX28 [Anolis carolinensis]|uniref:RNA helicase n=1 Tax=Anolis carolinensis TaxID=28377 RepID=H9GFJ1_ANOCA|nr:PREDICTED: probable ATP-dependent RNA helicase DDX28 [Anolis carolinensis]|eukprot:XP_003222990.1 PREDICTED: probable ATP-dependent RNA helicase DDX28 [Anolis carolinensis]